MRRNGHNTPRSKIVLMYMNLLSSPRSLQHSDGPGTPQVTQLNIVDALWAGTSGKSQVWGRFSGGKFAHDRYGGYRGRIYRSDAHIANFFAAPAVRLCDCDLCLCVRYSVSFVAQIMDRRCECAEGSGIDAAVHRFAVRTEFLLVLLCRRIRPSVLHTIHVLWQRLQLAVWLRPPRGGFGVFRLRWYCRHAPRASLYLSAGMCAPARVRCLLLLPGAVGLPSSSNDHVHFSLSLSLLSTH